MPSAQLQVHPSALRKPWANGRSCFFGQGDEGPVATSVTRRPTFVTRPPGWGRAAGRGERSPSTSPRTAIVTRVTLDLAGVAGGFTTTQRNASGPPQPGHAKPSELRSEYQLAERGC